MTSTNILIGTILYILLMWFSLRAYVRDEHGDAIYTLLVAFMILFILTR